MMPGLLKHKTNVEDEALTMMCSNKIRVRFTCSFAYLGDQTIRALFDGLWVLDVGHAMEKLRQLDKTPKVGMADMLVPKGPADSITDVQDQRRRGASVEEIVNDRLVVKVMQIISTFRWRDTAIKTRT